MRKVEYPAPLQELIRQLQRMPGIGPRSAERIALWIVQAPNSRPGEISEAITRCSKAVINCRECGFFAEGELCVICSDPARDRSVLCVIEQPTDILPLERTGAFNGVYHALGGKLSPLNHVGPEDLRFEALLQRIKLAGIELRVTRLAQGLPAGLGLESADDVTIARAFSGRTEFPR